MARSKPTKNSAKRRYCKKCETLVMSIHSHCPKCKEQMKKRTRKGGNPAKLQKFRTQANAELALKRLEIAKRKKKIAGV